MILVLIMLMMMSMMIWHWCWWWCCQWWCWSCCDDVDDDLTMMAMTTMMMRMMMMMVMVMVLMMVVMMMVVVVVVMMMISHVDWQLLCSVFITLIDDKTSLLPFFLWQVFGGLSLIGWFRSLHLCTVDEIGPAFQICHQMFWNVVFENKADFEKSGFNINEKFWSETCLA